MLGRGVRTLNKLFECIAYYPIEYDQLLAKLRETIGAKQKKVIEGLRY